MLEEAQVSRVKVKGHPAYAEIGDRTIRIVVWGWRCPNCAKHGAETALARACDEGRKHAKSCDKKPVQLVYAVRSPTYQWYTDPCFVQGDPGTDREAEVEASPMAVRYRDFPYDAPRDRAAAVVVKVPGRPGVLLVLDMTPAAAMQYRQALQPDTLS